MSKYFFFLLALLSSAKSFPQQPLISNIGSRNTISLNGKWQYIMDPYETGFRNYRWDERNENDREAYWNSDVPENKTDRKEHGYDEKYSLNVRAIGIHRKRNFYIMKEQFGIKNHLMYKSQIITRRYSFILVRLITVRMFI